VKSLISVSVADDSSVTLTMPILVSHVVDCSGTFGWFTAVYVITASRVRLILIG